MSDGQGVGSAARSVGGQVCVGRKDLILNSRIEWGVGVRSSRPAAVIGDGIPALGSLRNSVAGGFDRPIFANVRPVAMNRASIGMIRFAGGDRRLLACRTSSIPMVISLGGLMNAGVKPATGRIWQCLTFFGIHLQEGSAVHGHSDLARGRRASEGRGQNCLHNGPERRTARVQGSWPVAVQAGRHG